MRRIFKLLSKLILILIAIVVVALYVFYRVSISPISEIFQPPKVNISKLETKYLKESVGYDSIKTVEKLFLIRPFIDVYLNQKLKNPTESEELLRRVSRTIVHKYFNSNEEISKRSIDWHILNYFVANYLSHNWTKEELAKYYVESKPMIEIELIEYHVLEDYYREFRRPDFIKTKGFQKGVLNYKKENSLNYQYHCWNKEYLICALIETNYSKILDYLVIDDL